MRILKVDEPVSDRPCAEQRAVFLQLFGPQVEVTEELCRQHRHTFKPWAAVAWLYLTREGYYAWFKQWRQSGQDGFTDEQWDTYLGNQAAAFAVAFNEEGQTDGTSQAG